MKILKLTASLLVGVSLSACGLIYENSGTSNSVELPAFGQDLSFFSKSGIETVLLGDGDSLIAVSPALQGRVLTSTYGGAESPSIGWFNKRAISDKKLDRQTKDIGGEDRFWVGPEGGDFSIFFANGAIINEENWRIPTELCSEPWKLKGANKTQIKLVKEADFENIRGQKFKVMAEREVSVLSRKNVGEILGIEIPTSLDIVAFQSFNKLTNMGDAAWTPDTGMLNISVQSCFYANSGVRVFVPYRAGAPSKLGDIVRDNYFESLGTSTGRLTVAPDYVQFKADGRNMSGIGISPKRSEGIVLSYDSDNNILTVIMYIKPSGIRGYLANAWRRSAAGFDGDAISVYNNGPLARTSMVADSFYEVSTYSPALSLAAGKSQFHIQRTFHFHGSEYDLGLISYKLAGISISQLRGETE